MLSNLWDFLFPIIIAIIFAVIAVFFSGCALLEQECLEYPTYQACMKTYEDDISCYRVAGANDKTPFSYTQKEWEDESIGRVSVTAKDYVAIKQRLLQLEAITCGD